MHLMVVQDLHFNTHSLTGVIHSSPIIRIPYEFQYTLLYESDSDVAEDLQSVFNFITHSLAGVIHRC